MVTGSAMWKMSAVLAVLCRTAKNLAFVHFYSVFRVNFMVKLLRACVWMPWRKKAMKDVASCYKPRGDASNL